MSRVELVTFVAKLPKPERSTLTIVIRVARYEDYFAVTIIAPLVY
jgi:hypothetical protein